MNLDREIEDLLAVDHSPAFTARVRAGVAAGPGPGASWWSWRLVPAGGGLAALIAAVVLWPSIPSDRMTDIQPAPAPAAQVSAGPEVNAVRAVEAPPSDTAAPVATTPAASRAASRAPAGASTAAAAASAPPRAAAIVISPEDARAFRLLLTRTREGMVVDLPIDRDDPVAGPPWIEIAPVVIEPLAQLAQGEGGRQ